MKRPAEVAQASAGVLIGAILVLYGWAHGGFDFNSLKDPEVAGAITTLSSFVAAIVTWWVAKRQRSNLVSSGGDGTVGG